MNYSEKLKDPRWQKKRLEILQRDNFECRVCGNKKDTLNVHHIAYIDEPWDAKENQLITLCEECHNTETEDIKKEVSLCVKKLKESGLISNSFACLGDLFSEKDRGWTFFEPAFAIIKMAIEDDAIWSLLSELFWHRLSKKNYDNDIF